MKEFEKQVAMDVQFFNNSMNAVAAPVNPKDTPMMYSAAEPWGTMSTDYNNTQGISGAFYDRPGAQMMHPNQQTQLGQPETNPQQEYKPNFLVVAAVILLFVLLR